MQQSIRYKGLSLTPDEMAVENGALSLCGNLELHDGALRPSIVTGTPLSQPLTINGVVAKILYVHETGSYHHLIAIASSSIYWFMQDGTLGSSTPIKSFDYEASVLSVNSIGNTLIIVATDGIHYAVWLKDKYEYLGQKPPFMRILFSLSKEDQPENYETGGIDITGSADGFTVAFQVSTENVSNLLNIVESKAYKPGDAVADVKLEKQAELTESIWALINRTNSLIAKNGRFYANFMVRYCYRLYDGSTILHSAPVLMPVLIPNNYRVYNMNVVSWAGTKTPRNDDTAIDASDVKYDDFGRVVSASKVQLYTDTLKYNRKDAYGKEYSFTASNNVLMYQPRNVALMYACQRDVFSELQKWKNIVRSIDVYITPPITKTDSSQRINKFVLKTVDYTMRNVCPDQDWIISYAPSSGAYIYKGGFHNVSLAEIPSLTDENYCQKIRNTSSFFKIASLDLESISNFPAVSTNLPVDKSVIANVSLQQQMKDDYKSHNLITAKGAYVYNHRLNVYGISETLFDGFGLSMFPEGCRFFVNLDSSENQLSINKIVTVIETAEGQKIVEKNVSIQNINRAGLFNSMKFYPDSRATKMVFFCTLKNTSGQYSSHIYSFPLTECAELNGAMHLSFFTSDYSKYEVSEFTYSVDNVVYMPSKIYTSESDNPFFFPLNGINTVGIGTIQGIASTTRALSQGQFGQYPLMAFSTDGIWAMEVSSKGTYSSIHPISREVCSNPKSITQLDQSVIFATNRSLSRIAESQVVSMSDVLDGPGFNISGSLGKFLNFFVDAEGDSESVKTIKAQMRQLIDFTSSPIEFFQHCQVIYDYKNSRILCLDVTQTSRASTADTVALCYSIKDNAWSTFLIQNVLTSINSYPHPYIQYRDGSVMVLDKGYDYEYPTEYHGIIVTRTLKFDEDNVPDSITGYIHSLTSGSIPIMWLYGSNDNQNWHYIGRLGGMKSSYMATHSYRFFRIALYLKMKSMNQYFDTRLEIIRRFSKF